VSTARQAFDAELAKLGALAPTPAVQSLLRMPKVPGAKPVGTFGIADNYKKVAAVDLGYEGRTRPRWAQTLKDVPLSIGAMGLGYGVGRLAAEAAINQVSQNPQAMAHMPNVVGVVGGLTGLGLTGLRSFLKHRRDEAEREARTQP
jgi:hypothetical protein